MNTSKSKNLEFIKLTGQKSDLENARNFVSLALKNSKFSARDKNLLTVAVEEAVTRSFGTDKYDVTVGVEVTDTLFNVESMDTNNDYQINFADVKNTKNDNMNSPEDMSLYFILQIMDEVKYVYRRGFDNILSLIKFVPSY